MLFGKSLVSGGWKLLTFNGSIVDQSDEDSSMLPPELEVYIKSKFPSSFLFTSHCWFGIVSKP